MICLPALARQVKDKHCISGMCPHGVFGISGAAGFKPYLGYVATVCFRNYSVSSQKIIVMTRIKHFTSVN